MEAVIRRKKKKKKKKRKGEGNFTLQSSGIAALTHLTLAKTMPKPPH